MPISASTLVVLFLVALGVLALAWIKENSSAQAAVFVFHERITHLLRIPEVLTIYSPDYSNAYSSSRRYHALG